jgi:prepilin-type N-terminal cleavage/methylation domain-containing protein
LKPALVEARERSRNGTGFLPTRRGHIRVPVRRSRAARQGFTLIEVLVVVAIIALLISILLPSLSRARELARRVVCSAGMHSIGLAVQEYAVVNRGKIIECRFREIQIAMNPKYTSFVATPRDYDYVDWHQAARRYQIDKVIWECPNRKGVFGYEGNHPTMSQDQLVAAGYQWLGPGYNQWILGIQYFGGLGVEVDGQRYWRTSLPNPSRGDNFWPSRSPVDSENARSNWALAAEANLRVDGGWGRGRPGVFGRIPPHADPDGKPAGGNVLTMDGAVSWVNRHRLVPIHSWDPTNRVAYWWQQDTGGYLAEWRAQGRPIGIP